MKYSLGYMFRPQLGHHQALYMYRSFLLQYILGSQTVLYDVIIRRAQVKVGLINLSKCLFSLNARIYYKLKSGT